MLKKAGQSRHPKEIRLPGMTPSWTIPEKQPGKSPGSGPRRKAADGRAGTRFPFPPI
jgi:hypothetical protein